jgi:CHAD domain-containing protein
MRVGLRCLRAAISLFGSVLPGPSTAKIKAELKWLTTELAAAREIDVFVKEIIRPLGRATEPKRGMRAIEKQFFAQRKKAFQCARKAPETSRYRTLLIDILEWLEIRKSNGTDEAQTPIGQFVGDLVQRRLRKARKQGRRLDHLSAVKRHKLRIKIKKLRYAVEFFESLYSDEAQEELAQFSGRLKKIQDALGALNDFIAHREMATAAALNAPPQNRRARAFASGIIVGQEREAAKILTRSATKAFDRLRPLRVEPA